MGLETVTYTNLLIHILECNHLSVIGFYTVKTVCVSNSHVIVSNLWYEAGPQKLLNADYISIQVAMGISMSHVVVTVTPENSKQVHNIHNGI